MRNVRIRGPFTGGMVTDFPSWQIGPTNSAFAQDGYSPAGFYKQRQGWAYDGTTADVADNLVGIMRGKFAIAEATRTVTCDDDGDMFIHNPSSSGTALFTGTVGYLPRTMYRDEMIWCAQDGVTPFRRYAGASTTGSASDLVGTTTANRATISALGLSPQPDPGSYLASATSAPLTASYKILNSTSSLVTLEDATASATASTGTIAFALTGLPYPCVGIYNAGTISNAAGTVTGVGTLFSADAGAVALQDSVLQIDATTGEYHNRIITTVTSDTSLAVGGPTSTDITYQILRQPPFKDAAAHKESLWGTGVAQYPNRVYVSPPGWNPAMPPGFVLPYDVIPGGSTTASTNANDFLLDFIDVPSPYDGDHNVAILPSPSHLWVLKREKAYGIYGSFGGLEVSRDPIGPGCMDLRSAISTSEGSFWASDDNVWWARGNTPEPLMTGKIAREWKALTTGYAFAEATDWITCGVVSGYLIVHITTTAGGSRTYLCDLRDQTWQSRISNFTPRYMHSARIPGEAEKLLAVSNDRQGRVINFAPAVDSTGTALDDAGTGPRMQAWTGHNLGRADGVEGLTRIVDVDVHYNIVDAGAAGTTNMDVALASFGGINNATGVTTTLGQLNSATVDKVYRAHFRPTQKGREHQLRFDNDTTGTDTTNTRSEIHEIDLTVKDMRERAR